MFQSLYRLHQNEDRLQPEAVLTGRGVIVMLLIFLGEQVGAEVLSLLSNRYHLPLGLSEINLIVNGGALLLMVLFFGGFFLQNLRSFFREFKAIYLWLPITCYFCATFANIVIQLFLALIRGELQNTSNNEVVIQLLSQHPVQLILLTVLIAPITEEAVFRAAFSRPMTASRHTALKVLGILLSILLFSFVHVYQFVFFTTDASGATVLTFNPDELLSIVVYIPMATGLTLCSILGKNYWCSVICHIITNGMAVGLLLLLGQAA